MKTEIEQRQCDRFRILYETYKDSKADTSIKVRISELAADKNIKNGIFKAAFKYLCDEGLLSSNGAQTGQITHGGVKLVEYVLTHEDTPTELFPAFNSMGF